MIQTDHLIVSLRVRAYEYPRNTQYNIGVAESKLKAEVFFSYHNFASKVFQ